VHGDGAVITPTIGLMNFLLNNLMEEKEKLFDEAFKHLGGIIDYEQIQHPEVIQNLIIGCNEFIRWIKQDRPELPDVYINIINSDKLNAAATKYKNEYLIGISGSTIILISDLFFRMTANPNVLKDFGNIDNESVLEKTFNAQITTIKLLDLTSDVIAIPNDKSRQILAFFLTNTVFKFLIAHEYGHIVDGHCDFFNNKINDFTINEFPNGKPKLDPLISQALELDADLFAVTKVIIELEALLQNIEYVEDIYQPFYKNFETNLFLITYSMYTFHRMSGMTKYDEVDLKTISHPPASIRHGIALAQIGKMYEYKHRNETDLIGLKEKISYIMNLAMYEVETAFAAISEQPLSFDYLNFAGSDMAINHVSLILEQWNVIKPAVKEFAFENLHL